MKIEVIGTRGWSYAGMEDLVREMGPRFVRDGHTFTIHAWATNETIEKNLCFDVIQNGVKRVFHRTSYGKFSGQFLVALKASWNAALSDCDIIYYAFIQNGIYSWIPRLFGKKILSNVDGIMWKDPKWPWGFRQVFFVLGAYLTYFFSHRTITDSFHMHNLYRKQFRLKLDWIGYGCSSEIPIKREWQNENICPDEYYLIMSRITPHNLTDILLDGFIASGSKRSVIIAGHQPKSSWFEKLKKRADGRNIKFLGLIKDQDELTQIILHAKGYLHGHSLGGINPALVRIVGSNIPTLCIDTLYNREVVEYPNNKLQACLFQKNIKSVAEAIQTFEKNENYYLSEAKILGAKVRDIMSWENIYTKYREQMENCF